MKIIEQALFGYSNGHRLLRSSIKLSTASLRLMEMLSDLSGNDTSENFDGYYTGCWLPDENCYAFSKTWYATEMPRPGCAWTHTLFLDSQSFSTTIEMSIDSLFQRPNINNNDFLNYYSAPIKIELKNGSEYSNSCEALWLFQTIILKKENIAICYDNTLDFNLSFALLFQLMGVAFFKNFTFCTGSQANRMIKDKPLNLQVMPSKISKVALRTLSTVVPFEKNTSDLFPFFITNYDDLLKVKHFAVQIDGNHYSFEFFQIIQEIYYALYKVNMIDLERLILLNQSVFTSSQALIMFASELSFFVNDSLTNFNDSSVVLDLLFSISTTEEKYVDYINSLHVINFSQYIFELYNKERSSILGLIAKKLLVSKLNCFGEELLKELAFTINSDDLVQLVSEKQTYCTVLLQSNWKLAKNKMLWKMPLGIQLELIRNVAVAFNQSTYVDKALFSELLFLIFDNSSVGVIDEVYTAFGDFSITAFFHWIENDNVNKNNWIRICKNSPSQSLLLLQSVPHANFELFYSLLKVIDPWDKSIRTVEAGIWETLNDNYCKGKNNSQLDDMFAKFMLQVIINTNVKLSDTFACFIFTQVHKILESPNVDDAFWIKINSYLPEVKWYNSWDKCKRLRKYAKKIGYNNIFK